MLLKVFFLDDQFKKIQFELCVSTEAGFQFLLDSS